MPGAASILDPLDVIPQGILLAHAGKGLELDDEVTLCGRIQVADVGESAQGEGDLRSVDLTVDVPDGG